MESRHENVRSWWLTRASVSCSPPAMLFPVYWMINVSLTKTSNNAQEARPT